MRYIGGLDAQGRSTIVQRSEPPRVWEWTNSSEAAPHHVARGLTDDRSAIPAERTGTTAELWTVRSAEDRVISEDPGDYAHAPGEFSLDVPSGVMRWCVTRFGPGYASKLHFTDSIDLDLVIEGELYLVLETEEVLLRPGDSAVLHGLQHSWRTDTGAAIVYCMISPHAGYATAEPTVATGL